MPKIEKVAQALGVEIGEIFTFEGHEDDEFRFTEDRFEIRAYPHEDNRWVKCDVGFNHMLNLKIIKKSWKPREGEQYWYVDVDKEPCKTYWFGDVSDFAYYAIGNCFQTKGEAEAHVDSVINYMESIYECGREEVITDPRFMARLLFKFCMKNTCAECPFTACEEGKLCHIGEPHKWTYKKGGNVEER